MPEAVSSKTSRATNEVLAPDQDAEDLRWLMSDKRGRRVIYGLLGDCGIYRQSFDANNDRLTIWREGVRSVGLMLMDRVATHCPDRMSEMLKEVATK